MSKVLPDVTKHPEWIPPHRAEWYDRLASEYGKYAYPWKSEFDEPTVEMIFVQKITSYLNYESRVLDVGCVHGEFTNQFASKAKEIVGIDSKSDFIATANKIKLSDSIQFLVVNAEETLPFSDNYFDVVYTKKGPWLYNEGSMEGYRIIKPGGLVAGLYHGVTDGGFRKLFQGLYFYSPEGMNLTLQIQKMKNNLGSGLEDVDIQPIEEIEYLSTPEDVLIKKCFGQGKKLKEFAWRECLIDVEEIFYKNATSKGRLKVTNYYFLVTAGAAE